MDTLETLNKDAEIKTDDIEIIKSSKTELEFVTKGETHTLCNILRKYLMEDENVTYAVYGIDHPIIGHPIFTIKTRNKKSPKSSLVKALQKLDATNSEFKGLVESIS
ncbi:DNA-directed RNA polymerase subunit L [Methanobrevibacter curvatus]|uniref:DNA-directed RNA polymerase subunit Rpo11 n=1 Tax=Methanobrevibacter curvatus TaxID=49547 RepID=A0A162FPB5_9EURY|nr:DNA-directed RNA polymerase subunit L [Methanobrevibacter curvatus]KZX13080.1 DNA-directed RNA polymerase subunit L [Methanobrevibacter curvatus]